MSRIRGFVESLTREHVRGWAYDEDDPGRLLPIEIVVAGERIAVGQADQLREDLVGLGIGRSNAGFMVSLPTGVRVAIGEMEVRAPGTTENLPISESAGSYEGVLEQVQARTLSGWAWRCGYPEERIRIVVRHRGEIAASGYADDLREDLAQSGVGDGRHGFVIGLRVIEPPFEPETISVAFEATGAELLDLRPHGQKPVPPSVPLPAARPQNLFVQRPRERRPMAPGPAAEVSRAPSPPAPSPPVSSSPVAPNVVPVPPPKAEAPTSAFPLSQEAYEALRGALDFGGGEGSLP